MAEAFGLDTRILNLKGKRAVGFYMWDLECLHDVSDMAKPKAPAEQVPMIEALLVKLNHAMEECR